MKKNQDRIRRPVGRPVSGLRTERINISVPTELAGRLDEYILDNKITRSAVVVEALRRILD